MMNDELPYREVNDEKEKTYYENDNAVSLFSNNLDKKIEEATIVADEIYKEVINAIPAVDQLIASTNKRVRYVVDVSDDIIKDIKTGVIKLSKENGGKCYAQLRRANGQYDKKLPIKEELFNNMSPIQMANVLQLAALQNEIENIERDLKTIDSSIKDVLNGQQNDRISLYYSGKALYQEAMFIEDDKLRAELVAQSLRALADATFQVKMNMDNDIRFLVTGEYKKSTGRRKEEIDRRMQSINQAFLVIHDASLMRAGIYCNENQMPAAVNVLKEYGTFINNTIVKNARTLKECDINDEGGPDSIWDQRAKLELNTSALPRNLFTKTDTVYLSLKESE